MLQVEREAFQMNESFTDVLAKFVSAMVSLFIIRNTGACAVRYSVTHN